MREHQFVPYQSVTFIDCHRAIVLAPHPDDEVFGCGGAILRYVEAGHPIEVIIVTDGGGGIETLEREAYVQERQQESLKAARVLGYGMPSFWNLPDRGIFPDEGLIGRVQEAVESFRADLVYAPSLDEVHPDHWAVGMAAAEAMRRCRHHVRLAMYEVGVPLRPNVLLDISDIMEKKQAAMACFRSQLAHQAYDEHILALNRFRTYTLPQDVKAAEAYRIVNKDTLGEGFTRERALCERIERLEKALKRCKGKRIRWGFWRKQ